MGGHCVAVKLCLPYYHCSCYVVRFFNICRVAFNVLCFSLLVVFLSLFSFLCHAVHPVLTFAFLRVVSSWLGFPLHFLHALRAFFKFSAASAKYSKTQRTNSVKCEVCVCVCA